MDGILKEHPEITDERRDTLTFKHGVECHINTEGPPLKVPPRRLTPDKLQTAKKYFDLMCSAGICRRSSGQWISVLHMVPKKDGTVRPCGDYRRLNNVTIRDNYLSPHIHDCTASLKKCKIFSKVDLVKGYHQIPVRARDIEKTAIVTPFGLFEFARMPFGLKNAVQTFQPLMDVVTKDLEGVFVYLDDVLVAPETESQHRKHLRALFDPLKKFGLVINVKKRAFGKRSVEFLGHMVSEQQIVPLEHRVEAIKAFERPRDIKALQRFLGMINFYRLFVPNIALTLQPLTAALQGNPKQLNGRSKWRLRSRQQKVHWQKPHSWHTLTGMLNSGCVRMPVRKLWGLQCSRK